MDISRLTYLNFNQRIDQNSTIILPVGALEAHGPHLPLATDTICAEGISRKLGAELDVLVAPACHYGVTNSLFGYSGGVRLHPETFRAYMKDVITSFIGHGATRIIIINGHGGNREVLEQLSKKITDHYMRMGTSVQLIVIDWYRVTHPLVEEIYGKKGGHAGLDETALILSFEPGTVDQSVDIDPLMSTTISDGIRAYPIEAPILLYDREHIQPDFDKDKALVFMEKAVAMLKIAIIELIQKSEHNIK